MNSWLHEILLSPRSNCLGCGSVRGTDHEWLCSDCYASIVPLVSSGSSVGVICSNCGEEYAASRCSVCGKRNVATLQAAAAYEYEGAVQNLIRAFKFRGVWRMGGWMASEMLRACDDAFLDGVTVVVPVPMHTVRKLVRGYNQSDKLARAFSKLSGIRFEDALKRIRNTKQQSKLSTDARRKNLIGAFRAKKNFLDETVLLIDDVRTTGSTVAECAKALRAAGAKEVRVLTFAKAVVHKPQSKNIGRTEERRSS